MPFSGQRVTLPIPVVAAWMLIVAQSAHGQPPQDDLGACCNCPGVCTPDVTETQCAATGGAWIANAPCDPNPCPLVPDNNDCEDAQSFTDPSYEPGGLTIPFNNICATDDGPELGCGDGNFHFDIWYFHTVLDCDPQCRFDLTVSTCDLAAFNTIIAFYDGSPAACPVSEADLFSLCGPSAEEDCCADDTCGIPTGPSELSVELRPGDQILIRVGGYYDAAQGVGDGRGWGAINFAAQWHYDPIDCIKPPPEPPNCAPLVKFCQGGIADGNPCETDSDCPGGNCWDDCRGDYRAASCVVYDEYTGASRCYIPKNRYLTIDTRGCSSPFAIHVTLSELDDQYNDSCLPIEGFLSNPVCVDNRFGQPVDPQPAPTDPCQGPELFGWVSYIVDGPVVPRAWGEYPLYITGCEVVPAATYELRPSADGVVPSVFDPLLILTTTHDPLGDSQHWGDVTSDPGLSIPWMPPEYATSFSDVAAVIKTFEGSGGPAREWCDLEIDHVVSFSDISFAIKAFEGKTYAQITDTSSPSARPLIGWEPCDCP